jgi:hypothetical protein
MIHKIQQISLILFAFIFIFSCKKDSDSNSTPSETKTLIVKPGSLNLITGSSEELSLYWKDKAGVETKANETATWSSSNIVTATVDANGIVVAIVPGTATIKGKIGSREATATITVVGLQTTGKVLFINQPSVSLSIGEKFSLTTRFVDQTATESTPSGVSWSSSDNAVATISASGELTAKAEGAGFITASISESGTTYTTKIPFSVKKAVSSGGSGQSTIQGMVVAPAAILWSDGNPNETLQLEVVYFGSGSLTSQTFTSSNTAVANVNSTGLVTLKTSGEAIITVTATGGGTSYNQKIPVVVVAMPTVALPVYRVELTPGIQKAFMDKTVQYTAKAYNSAGVEVTGKTVKWEIEDTEPDTIENDPLEIEYAASVNSSGLVTTIAPRPVKVKATIEGVTGVADLIIYPDGYYTVNPLLFTISPSGSQSLTASYFEFDANFNAQAKTFPASTMWYTLNDLLGGFGFPLPIIGKLTSSGNPRTYTVDPSSMSPIGADVVIVGDLTKKKILPGISSANIQ